MLCDNGTSTSTVGDDEYRYDDESSSYSSESEGEYTSRENIHEAGNSDVDQEVITKRQQLGTEVGHSFAVPGRYALNVTSTRRFSSKVLMLAMKTIDVPLPMRNRELSQLSTQILSLAINSQRNQSSSLSRALESI